MKTLLCCSQCGGQNVMVRAWVDANTNEFCSDYDDGEAYCEDCGEDVSLDEMEVEG